LGGIKYSSFPHQITLHIPYITKKQTLNYREQSDGYWRVWGVKQVMVLRMALVLSTGCCDESLNSTPETNIAMYVDWLGFEQKLGEKKKNTVSVTSTTI